jgi:predicted PurR-regulated permease PerM
MIYVLITVGAFISIITTWIFKSITKKTKHQNLKRAIVIIISFIIFAFLCVFLLGQKGYQ